MKGSPEPGVYALKMRAFPGRPLLLREHGSCAEVLTEIGGKSAILSGAFVSATKGLFPSVMFVDVFGVDPETRSPVSERIDTGGRSR